MSTKNLPMATCGKRVKLPFDDDGKWRHVEDALKKARVEFVNQNYAAAFEELSVASQQSGSSARANAYRGLLDFVSYNTSDDERRSYTTRTLPFIIDCALKMKDCKPTKGLFYSFPGVGGEYELSWDFVTSMVASAFLCILPAHHPDDCESFNTNGYHHFFASLLRAPSRQAEAAAQAKLRMILNFFDCLATRKCPDSARNVVYDSPVTVKDNHEEVVAIKDKHIEVLTDKGNHEGVVNVEDNLEGVVTINENHEGLAADKDNPAGVFNVKDDNEDIATVKNDHEGVVTVKDNHDGGVAAENCIIYKRVVHSTTHTLEWWCSLAKPLCPFTVLPKNARIEEYPDCLQVDFANKFIGGGVLYSGLVQEEIMFSACPQLQAAMFFMAVMSDNEAIQIHNFERFSDYTGYAESLRFAGSSEDYTKLHVTAIDAEPHFNDKIRQYDDECILRELNKAYVGFTQVDGDDPEGQSSRLPIATGNWGCGVFGGDPQLKSMLQWVAASAASAPCVKYCTFGLTSLSELECVSRHVLERRTTVGAFLKTLVDQCVKIRKLTANGPAPPSLFALLREAL